MDLKGMIGRCVGLFALAAKAAFARGHVSFGPTVLASPSLRIHADYGAKLILGRRAVVSYDSDICAIGSATIELGEAVYLGPRCMLSAHEAIRIGSGSLFGPDVKIFDNNHVFQPANGVVKGLHRAAPVTVGKNVWLGANVVVLKGVTIGDGAVIGAGVVVRHDVPAGAVLRPNEVEIADVPGRA